MVRKGQQVPAHGIRGCRAPSVEEVGEIGLMSKWQQSQ